MLLSQADFDCAFEDALALQENEKSAERQLARRFRHYIESGGSNLREYLHILLMAYLAKPYRIRLWRNSQKNRSESHLRCRFVFGLEPFRYDNEDYPRKLMVNEDDLLKPVALRDYLSRRFYCIAEFSSFQFGCLEVEYCVPGLPVDWIALLDADDEFGEIQSQLGIKYYS